MTFRFRSSGETHEKGNPDCAGCQKVFGTKYPRPHGDFGRECAGLVHGETLEDKGEWVAICGCDLCTPNPGDPQNEVQFSVKEIQIPRFHNN
jgi:hypothetical protein